MLAPGLSPRFDPGGVQTTGRRQIATSGVVSRTVDQVGEAVNGPARRRPGGCALGELAQVQEPIEREEQQVSTETNERDEERTDQVGNGHGHERDQAARRIGDRAASTTDTGERVTLEDQEPGHGGRPPAAERAGNFDHTLRTCPPTRTAAAGAGEKTPRAQSWP